MIRNTFPDDMINIILRQAGATSITTSLAHINIVKFQVAADVKVEYVYEVKENGEIYLQRTSPYPMLMGKMFNEEALTELVKCDVASFSNAYRSRNYHKFLQIVKSHLRFDNSVEELFMNHNVSPEDLDYLHSAFERVHQLLSDIKERSELLESTLDNGNSNESDGEENIEQDV